MGPVATRRLLRRLRRRTAGVTALAAVVVAVVACYALPTMAEGCAHHDVDAAATATACVVAVAVAGAAVVAIALGVVRLGRWRPVARIAPGRQADAADVPLGVPRAGPQLLLLLCVSRR